MGVYIYSEKQLHLFLTIKLSISVANNSYPLILFSNTYKYKLLPGGQLFGVNCPGLKSIGSAANLKLF